MGQHRSVYQPQIPVPSRAIYIHRPSLCVCVYIYKHTRTYVQWTQNICEPGLRHSKRKGRCKQQARSKTPSTRHLVAVLLSTQYLGWLAATVCICQGQRSSEIFCGMYILRWFWIVKLVRLRNRKRKSILFTLTAIFCPLGLCFRLQRQCIGLPLRGR
jgi:hypothetical protein